MKLYLIQHGSALAKEVNPERPLSDEGRADVEALATLLSSHDVTVPSVYHSTKLRARQTAEILARALAGHPVEASGLAPDDPVETWLEWLEQPHDDGIAIVSHQPFVGHLATRLLTGREEPAAVVFSPGTALCLEVVAGTWALRWMVGPALLRTA
ncbi:phosphohistidine phosphatase SixA [Arhodomonas sp. AD133]|uniref:phosphohistidine phosphatase SixA n=1 Tax=Arhodomonas sp. AD133 TaxID=3415009 RepID=UPI003EB830F9